MLHHSAEQVLACTTPCHSSSCHAALAPLIEQHGVPDKLLAKGFTNMFNSLVRSILSQQLAVKAASVIQGRFMALCQVTLATEFFFVLLLLLFHLVSAFGAEPCPDLSRLKKPDNSVIEASGLTNASLVQCEHVVTPEAVLPLSEDQMRGVGLSYAKVKFPDCC